jgi:hypothetical protein
MLQLALLTEAEIGVIGPPILSRLPRERLRKNYKWPQTTYPT